MVSGKKERQHQQLSDASVEGERDSSLATRAFELSLFFWVPVVNLFINPLAITYAIIAIVKQARNPKQYGGLRFAVAALSICFFGLFILLYSLAVLGPSVVLSSSRDAAGFDMSIYFYIAAIVVEIIGILVARKLGLIPKTPAHPSRDTSLATIAFITSFFFWVPLFSIFANPIAVVLSIIALYRSVKYPEKYGGFKRALFALEVCGVGLLLFIYAIVFLGPSVVFNR